MSVFQDSFPLKVRGIHLVNEPMFFRPVFAMIRPFLADKIKQRVCSFPLVPLSHRNLYLCPYTGPCLCLQIHMHGADFHNTLSKFFSPTILPPEYGGEGPEIEKACQDWTNQLLQSETLLQQIAAHPTADIAITPDDSDIGQK